MLRVAFAGTPEFAVPTLQALAQSGHRLVGVLTQPDRPAGRGRQIHPSPVKALALQLGVPIHQPQRLRSGEDLAHLTQWRPDVLVVVAYGLLLGEAALRVPRLGCVNVHASLLPRWRGAAPIQHAILAGDAQTGVTIMQMDAGLDTGPILAARPVSIGADVSAGQLQQQLAEEGARLLLPTLDAYAAGTLKPWAQADHGVTYAPKLDKALARIDWGLQAAQIARQVRAFNPRPVAHTGWYGEPLRIWEAEALAPEQVAATLESLSPAISAVPGTVLGLQGERLLVQCGQGVLAVARLQRAGRRVVLAREFEQSAAPVGARFDD